MTHDLPDGELPEQLIVDAALRHGQSSCHGRAPQHFRWRWIDAADGYEFPNLPVFFTDKALMEARGFYCGRKIGWLLEPRAIQPETYLFVEENSGVFDVILTFDRDLIAKMPDRCQFYPFGGCWIDDSAIRRYPKTKRCSIIASAKDKTEGQRFRHEVVRALGDKVDVFGRGYYPIDDKIEALRDYELTVVIENSIQNDYFSEKLLDALATGTTPLYWGSERVKDYFPAGIYPFRDVAQLRELIDSVIPKAVHLEENLKRLHEFKLSEDWLWREYPWLFKEVGSPSGSLRPKIRDYLTGGDRFVAKISSLRKELFQLRSQRDKERARNERLRRERDVALRERNEARAQRDQLVAKRDNPCD